MSKIPTTYIGIDPGAKGGISIINKDGVQCVPFSSDALKTMVASVDNANSVAYVELVGAHPGQGVVSMFNFGENYGFILGILFAYGIRTERVSPQRWKRHFSLLKQSKTASIEKAETFFPSVSFIPKGCRAKKDGMAESLLICLYGKEAEKAKAGT